MTKLTILGVLLLVAGLTVFTAGCTMGEDASASPDESSEAPSGQSGDSAGGGDGDGATATNKDDKAKDEDDEDAEEAVPVEVAALNVGPIESVLRFSANLEAESQVQVFSQARRLVTELLVEEGDRVGKNDVLLRLQNDEQHSQLSKVKRRMAKAEREFEQQQRLFEQDLISEQVFNETTLVLDQVRLEIEDAERELSYAEVRAPIAGTVTSRIVNLGDQVQIGQHLFDIVDFDSIVARVFVPESNLKQLRPGQTARVFASASSVDAYSARIQRIAPIVDPRSGTIKVTVAVGGQPGLLPGMYVDVDLVTAKHSSAVLIPKRALIYDDDQMFVYRLAAERRVERVFFNALLADKHNVVPVDGLQAGDEIVVAGQTGLKDGALVSLPGDDVEDDDAAGSDASDEAMERAAL